ncbi:excalibur calcium-binding domain-containing protein [Tsukamurella sp. 1534]|uniref:excalibur calcium-binding domain-containing protein n=1 Tax=Tsukamurella sp. 1534 TaxID=1151061 RepID=UPI001ED9A543|nr:excalibur calcium-binding domain-containing protein [Tsukamurella sp. 1534]
MLIAFGVLGALGALVSGDGAGGKVGGFLIGLAIAGLGALLVWPINWKVGVPAAVVALFLGGAVSPDEPETAPVVSPASSTVSTSTVTVTSTMSSTPASSSTTSTSTPATTTTTRVTTVPPTTTTVNPPPRVAETDTRTPVPTPPRMAPTTEYTTPAAPAPSLGGYESCAEARRAGAAPLSPGSPGWNPKLDRDNDGIACE